MAGPAEANGWGDVRVTVSDSWTTTRVIPHEDELVEAAKRVLSNQYSVLWGQTFNILDEKDVAAEWLAGYVRAVLREAWWPNWSQNL